MWCGVVWCVVMWCDVDVVLEVQCRATRLETHEDGRTSSVRRQPRRHPALSHPRRRQRRETSRSRAGGGTKTAGPPGSRRRPGRHARPARERERDRERERGLGLWGWRLSWYFNKPVVICWGPGGREGGARRCVFVCRTFAAPSAPAPSPSPYLPRYTLSTA